MDNSVVIKGNSHGIVVILDSQIDFSLLKVKVAAKFSDSAKFLGACKTAVSFEGRELNADQQLELLEVIKDNSNLEVVCILDNDSSADKSFEKAVNDQLMINAANSARFFKGNLRSGQEMAFDTSVIVLGDVNPGATIISTGNIIICGSLRGNAYAGSSGNQSAFVMAFDMNPMQIRIADAIARSSDDKSSKTTVKENKIAFLEDGCIYIEPVNKSIYNQLTID